MATAQTPVGLGWDDHLEEAWEAGRTEGLSRARVARVDRGGVTAWCEVGEPIRATTGTATADSVTGDWVGLDRSTGRIERVLPRRTELVRRAARGAARAQRIAANVDVVLVMQALDPGVNPRRLERELVVANQSGARAMVVLSKLDLVDDPDPALSLARSVSAGTEVLAVSNVNGAGLPDLRERLSPPATLALLGASGVGKSSLANALGREARQAVAAVRRGDGKGRHTTTAAELLELDDDLLLIDTPGIRALGVWDIDRGLALTFPEIAGLEGSCRFEDCAHRSEPGCAVLEAVASGRVEAARVEHWHRLIEEAGERA